MTEISRNVHSRYRRHPGGSLNSAGASRVNQLGNLMARSCPVGREAVLAASADRAAPAGASFRNAGVLAPPTGYPKKYALPIDTKAKDGMLREVVVRGEGEHDAREVSGCRRSVGNFFHTCAGQHH